MQGIIRQRISSIPRLCISPKDFHCGRGAAILLAQAIRGYNFERFHICHLNCGPRLPEKIPIASNPLWANQPFGGNDTVERVKDAVLCTSVVLDYLAGHISDKISLSDIPRIGELFYHFVSKNYCVWKPGSLPGLMYEPVATLDVYKKHFPDDEFIQQCTSIDEVFAKYQKPVCMNGAVDWFENIIKAFSQNDDVDIYLCNVQEIIANLNREIPVPICVDNSIYSPDGTNINNHHYIVLFRIEGTEAVVVDPSKVETAGIHRLPVERLFKAISSSLIMAIAWDLRPAVKGIMRLSA